MTTSSFFRKNRKDSRIRSTTNGPASEYVQETERVFSFMTHLLGGFYAPAFANLRLRTKKSPHRNGTGLKVQIRYYSFASDLDLCYIDIFSNYSTECMPDCACAISGKRFLHSSSHFIVFSASGWHWAYFVSSNSCHFARI